jgi:2-succinyl-5-enolpyruvyl-6-hydroxy-3-cyclohexene-1-carboxylate synthase
VRVETVAAAPRWADVGRGTATVALGLEGSATGPLAEHWLSSWRAAAQQVAAAVDTVVDGGAGNGAESGLTAARLGRDLVAALPAGALLVLGSSTPVRDVDRIAVPRGDLRVLANRGVAGIDGTVSTAVGAALAHGGRAVALIGDLTFLHDLSGLLLGEGERAPDLTLVVLDNDGGGIFAQLEPGEERHARDYRRVFGTPHGRDLVAVAASLGWPAGTAGSTEELVAALQAGGPRVVVVRGDQRAEAEQVRGLRSAAARALTG